MWLSRAVYATEHDARIKAESINAAIVTHNAALKTTADWLMMRLTQLEMQNAQLLKTYLGVTIPVPSFEPDTPRISASDILNQTMSFDDMGDAAAVAAGIDWDEQGELIYGKK
jgi:hypothetical protein